MPGDGSGGRRDALQLMGALSAQRIAFFLLISRILQRKKGAILKPLMVAFDVAGTTVSDGGVVIEAFSQAFQRTQPELWAQKSEELMAYALKTMGQSKIAVFTHLTGDAQQAEIANVAFEQAYLEEVELNGVSPIPGTEETFEFLRSEAIHIVLTTGFSRPTLDVILKALDWQSKISLSVTPAEAGRGRPFPDMLIKAANDLHVEDHANTMVVGDTVADIQAGLAFGASRVIGVLTGAHTNQMFIEANATSVVNSVADLPSLI
ncbi:MAG: HAD-IA family hydrolase [Actinomycetes bacterium]